MDLLELINEKIDQNQEHTTQRLDSIDHNLKEHMRRTDMLEDLHRDNEKRIVLLEEPRKYISNTFKIVITLGSLAGASYGIIKFLGVL